MTNNRKDDSSEMHLRRPGWMAQGSSLDTYELGLVGTGGRLSLFRVGNITVDRSLFHNGDKWEDPDIFLLDVERFGSYIRRSKKKKSRCTVRTARQGGNKGVPASAEQDPREANLTGFSSA
jgi:hypothetical protein